MAWTLHLQPIENPWADAAMLAGARAMYVAQAFEEKCRSLLRIGHIVAGIESDPIAGLEDLVERVPKDKLLGPTLTDLASVWPDAAQHHVVLSSAREARNYIAHESMRFGIHSRWDNPFERMSELRRMVRMLAHGDNLVSTWWFYIEERHQPTPSWLIAEYPTMIDKWVFEPVWDLLGDPIQPDGTRDGEA